MKTRTNRKAAGGSLDAPDLGVLAGLMGYQVRTTQIAIFRDFETTLAQFDMSPARFTLLSLIGESPGLPQSRLAEAVLLDRSSLVPVIDRLEQEQLVERRPAPDDRRSNSVWLTRRGEKLLSQLKPLVADHEERMLEGFSNEERKKLIEFLRRIRTNLEA